MIELTGKQIRRYLYLIIALAFASGLFAGWQSKPASYVPTREQHLELEVKQKDAIIAQIQFKQAQQGLQRSYQELDDAATAIKKANGWPSDIQFNQETLTFAPAPTPPPAPKPAEKKP